MGFLDKLFKTKEEAAGELSINCPVCGHIWRPTRATVAALLQVASPAFRCGSCGAEITATVLRDPAVSEMLTQIEKLRFQNDAAKEAVIELREPGNKELAAKAEQTALVRLQEDYDMLHTRTDKIEVDNRQLRQQNEQLRSGMEASAAEYRYMKSQLEQAGEPHFEFFVEEKDAKNCTRLKCTGCFTELVLRCPKCKRYHVVVVRVRAKNNELVLLQRLESKAHSTERDVTGLLMVE